MNRPGKETRQPNSPVLLTSHLSPSTFHFPLSTFYLLPFLLLAFALRMINLGRLGLWGDEAWGLYLNHLGLVGLTIETARDMHPPVYHYVSYFWAQAAGSGEFALRYISVFAGTLSVAATYTLGRRLAGRRAGMLSALLMACAPFAVYYSQEARPYIMALLWCVLAAYVLLRALQRPTRLAWAGYGVMSFLAAFTLYSTALWIGMHGLLVLARRDWRRCFPTWLGVEMGVLLLSAPWLWLFGRAIGTEIKVQGEFTARAVLPLHSLAARMVQGMLAGITLPASTSLWIAALLAALGAGGMALARRRGWMAAALPAALAFLPVIVLYPIHLYLPWFEPRVLVFCAAPLYVLLAAGLDGWLSRGAGWLAAAGMMVAAVWGVALNDYYHFDRYSPAVEDYRPLIARVQSAAAPGDVVLYNARWNVGYFEAYYGGPALDFRPLLPASIEGIQDRPRQVWVVARDIVRHPGGPRPEDQAEDALSAAAFKVEEAWFGQVRLARYVIAPQGAAARHFVNVAFERGVALSEFVIQAAESDDGVLVVRPGQALYLNLIWQASQTLDIAYNVFSHIIGPINPATGNPVWAQHDGVPGNQERPPTSWAAGEKVLDRRVMWVNAAAPPGDYALEVGLYDPGTGARLRVVQPDGALADSAILMRVRVIEP